MSVGPVTVYAFVLDARSFAGAGCGVAAWRRGAWGCQGGKKGAQDEWYKLFMNFRFEREKKPRLWIWNIT